MPVIVNKSEFEQLGESSGKIVSADEFGFESKPVAVTDTAPTFLPEGDMAATPQPKNVVSAKEFGIELTEQDKGRIKKYGAISAEPEKAWWKSALDFSKELLPYSYMATASGRELHNALPEPAKADRNFLEFTKALDWMIGGEGGIAFAGKALRNRAAKNSAQAIIDSLAKEPAVATGMPLLKPKEGIVKSTVPPTVKTMVEKATGEDTVIDAIVKHDEFIKAVDGLRPDQLRTVKDGKAAIQEALDKQASLGQPLLKPKTGVVTSKIPEKLKTTLHEAEAALPGTEPPLRADQIGSPLLKPKEGVVKSIIPASFRWGKLHGLNSVDMAGGIAGAEFDDEGNFTGFNPAKAAIGIAAAAGMHNMYGNRQAIAETASKYFWKPVAAKDVSLWEQVVTPPQWLSKKFPVVKNFFNIQRARDQARSEIAYNLLQEGEAFFKLKKDDFIIARELLTQGDVQGKVFTKEQLLKAGANDNVVKGYESARKVLDNINTDYFVRMKQWGIPDDEILKLRQQMGNIEGYFPRHRQGKYFIKAEKEGEAPIRQHFNSLTGYQGAKIRNDLIKKGYTITDSGPVSKLPEEVYHKISPHDISAVFDAATTGWDDAVRKSLKQNIADTFKERGFMQHGMKRQTDLITGYETENLKNVMFNYINGYAGFVTKAEAGKQFSKELMGLAFSSADDVGAKKTPGLYKWANKYVKDMMQNTDIYDDISSNLRSAFFFKHLGGVLKSSAVNLTQNYVMGAPRLSLETKGAYIKITKAMSDIVGHYKGASLVDDETRALRVALQKGYGQDQFTQELMGHLSTYGTQVEAVKKAAGFFMSTSEKFNRQSAFLAAYRVFRDKAEKQGLKGEDAFKWMIEKAGNVVDESHGVYGKSNLPGAVRGGPLAKIGRSAYTFRTVPHLYINLLSNMWGVDKKAVAKSIATLGTLGGVSSLPFYKSVEALTSRFGFNARSELKKKAEDLGMPLTGDLVNYGLPALLDIDLGGSIGIEAPGQKAVATGNAKELLTETAIDILGVPGSLVGDTLSATEQLYYGDVYRAIEESPVTPQVFTNAMAAYRLNKEGYTTKAGSPIWEEGTFTEKQKLSTKQAIQKGVFGFQSVKASDQYRKHEAKQAETARWERESKKIQAQFKKVAVRKGLDSNDMDKIWDKIDNYNIKKPDYISEIDPGRWIDSLYYDDTSAKEILMEAEVR